MADPQVRRLHAALDASLAHLEESREMLAKAWLLRVIERTPLDEVERLPTDLIARELPGLIVELVRAVADPEAADLSGPGSELHRRATALTGLREGTADAAAQLPHDIASLQSVLIGALSRELHEDPATLAGAIERLARVFADLQAAVVSEALAGRSRELEFLAHTDGLTNLYNLRYLQQQMTYLLELQQRYGHPFALLLMDVDGLKRVNDSYGHAAGDRLLVGVAETIRETVRGVDVAARIGGDEFCVLAPHQTASRALAIGDRLAQTVESLDADGARVGISIGVVSCPQHGLDPDRLLELADDAMYRAKAAGERVAVGEQNGEPAASENGC